TFFAAVAEAFEQQINLLMQRHAQSPAAGYDHEAFRLSERVRARTLLELLTEARAELEQGVEPQLLAQAQEAQKTLSQAAERCLRLPSSQATPSESAACRERVRKLTDEY